MRLLFLPLSSLHIPRSSLFLQIFGSQVLHRFRAGIGCLSNSRCNPCRTKCNGGCKGKCAQKRTGCLCFFPHPVWNGISLAGREGGRVSASLFAVIFLSAVGVTAAETKERCGREWTRKVFVGKGSGCLESILWLFKRWTPNSLISTVGITVSYCCAF